MDKSLFFLINQGLQNKVFDVIMPFITTKAYIFFILIVILTFFKNRQKGLFVIFLCSIALVIGDASSNILKHLFERPRPCQSLDGVRLLVGCGESFSLPSNHAVNAFAIATTFSYFFRRYILPSFLIAAIIAFSRIYVGVHYPVDVITGVVWGVIMGGLIISLHKWMLERIKEEPYITILFASVVVLTLFRYYYILTSPFDLAPDEAHYWEWSRNLDLSYYSKGPAIAYLIAATTYMTGDTVLGVRFLAPLFLALSSIAIFKLTLELFPEDKNINIKACLSALLLQITPLFATYGVVMTIDSPLIFFWTLSLYLFWKAVSKVSGVRGQGSGNSELQIPNSKLRTSNFELQTWLLLGLTVGLGLLTKYTMAFFYLCGFLFILLSEKHRFWFKKRGPYFAFIISLLIFAPVIIWNGNHDWVTFKHTAGQAHISEGLKISIKDFFSFLGSQIGVITPVLFLLVVYGAMKGYVAHLTSNVRLYLFCFWVPILGFFLLKSLHGKVQANWAMPAYITAFIASSDYYLQKDTIKKSMKVLLSIALIMAASVTAIAHYPAIINLPVRMDLTSRLKGWKELGERVEEIHKSMVSSGSRGVFIFSDRYQISSELAFYMPSRPKTYCVNLGRRMNQYDIWGGFNKLLGLDAIFVKIGDENFPERLKNSFKFYEREKLILKKKEKVLREYSIFRCYGFKGLPLMSIESY